MNLEPNQQKLKMLIQNGPLSSGPSQLTWLEEHQESPATASGLCNDQAHIPKSSIPLDEAISQKVCVVTKGYWAPWEGPLGKPQVQNPQLVHFLNDPKPPTLNPRRAEPRGVKAVALNSASFAWASGLFPAPLWV